MINGIIRHEGEIDVLETIRFAARHNMVLSPETAEYGETLKPSVMPDGTWEFFRDGLEQSIKPSRLIEGLRETGWVSFFPEIDEWVDDNKIDCYNGDLLMIFVEMFNEAGASVAESFFERINAPVEFRRRVSLILRRYKMPLVERDLLGLVVNCQPPVYINGEREVYLFEFSPTGLVNLWLN